MKRDALCTVELSSHHLNERRQSVEHTHAPRWAESCQWCKIFRWRRPCSKIAGGYGPGYQRGRWGPWWTPGCSSAWWSSEASSALTEGPRPSTWAWRLRPHHSSAPTATATATWCPGRGISQGRNQTEALCQSITWCPGRGIPQGRNQTEALCQSLDVLGAAFPKRGIRLRHCVSQSLDVLGEAFPKGGIRLGHCVSHLVSWERHSPNEDSDWGTVSVTLCPGRGISRGRSQSEALCQSLDVLGEAFPKEGISLRHCVSQSLDVLGEAFPKGGIRLRHCVSHLMSRERHFPREESVWGPVSVYSDAPTLQASLFGTLLEEGCHGQRLRRLVFARCTVRLVSFSLVSYIHTEKRSCKPRLA